MNDSTGIWPQVGDARILHALEKQVTGALRDLHTCTEDGFGHLEKALDRHPKSEVTPHIIQALTDLQKIDRATQRLQNVADSLDEWFGAECSGMSDAVSHGRPSWADAIAARFVMPEEKTVLRLALEEK